MEQLWSHVKNQLELLQGNGIGKNVSSSHQLQEIHAFGSGATFCDLFVHHLLAMDDDEFLLSYTSHNTNRKAKSSIAAVELIELLKSNLHILYWAKPVVVHDVVLPMDVVGSTMDKKVACQKSRFLLSGTKLWNVLHQLWSRLYTTNKFCEKECWYFPRLVTKGKDEEGAIFGTRDEYQDVDMDENNGDDDSASSMDIDDNYERVTTNTVDEENDALASSFKDPKMARILASIPQAIPFDRRVRLFNSLLAVDLAHSQDESQDAQRMVESMLNGEDAEFQGRIQANIHRDQIYQDSMDQLNKFGPKLRKKISVKFTNQVGALEAGIDGGGVFREFLDDLIKEAFNPEKKHGNIGPLFISSPLETLLVNTTISPTPQVLSHYQFLGRVL
jgi:hypothetical protein